MDDATSTKRYSTRNFGWYFWTSNIWNFESEALKMRKFEALANRVLEGHTLTDTEALSILRSEDEDLLPLLHAAYIIRKRYYGNKVKLNMIMNTKSGLCPENCGYCAQSIVSKAPIEKYSMMKREEIIAGAQRASHLNAGTYCIVASGRGPADRELDFVVDSVKLIK